MKKKCQSTFTILYILFNIYIGKETLKAHQQQVAIEISRARAALSGPLRRKFSNITFLPFFCMYIDKVYGLFFDKQFYTLIFGVISNYNLL
jgi:hypothetical protein